MTTAAATLNSRDPFMPRRPPGMKSGLALALLAHALLVAGLAYSVDWHASEPEAVEAELWSALPQQAAPAPAPPPPQAVQAPPPPPAPAPKPQPVQPPPPPQVDPQIAIEKAREARRVQALAEQDAARRDKARRDQARQDEAERKAAEQQARDDALRKKQQSDKQQADKEKAEQAKVEQAKADKAAAAQREAARLAQIKRMQSLAGATGDKAATGTALKSSGPSASYAGRIVARIKPNIVFPDAVDGNPVATVEVRVAPDGTITGKRLVQSSGVKAWDDAVLRAIDRTDGLPRDIDGRVPPVLAINFRPRDL